jgi:hypothetical protein
VVIAGHRLPLAWTQGKTPWARFFGGPAAPIPILQGRPDLLAGTLCLIAQVVNIEAWDVPKGYAVNTLECDQELLSDEFAALKGRFRCTIELSLRN